MNTATYIKEVNNTPVLFNIDNARDMANLEALQAIKMPENMADEIFGENAEYADNTTCIITQNPDNPDFPFNVQFDSSKIPAKPQTQRKLTDSYISGLGMPTEKFIDITSYFDTNQAFIAPANGYVRVSMTSQSEPGWVNVRSTKNKDNANTILYAVGYPVYGTGVDFIPVQKGSRVFINSSNVKNGKIARFIYAQGEI